VLRKADEFNYLPLVERVNFSFINIVLWNYLSQFHFLQPMLNFTGGIQQNPVITTSVYATPRLQRQIFCGTKQFVTANHNTTLVGYKDIKYSVHEIITEFDCIMITICTIYHNIQILFTLQTGCLYSKLWGFDGGVLTQSPSFGLVDRLKLF
jgi:hypothetical protein